MTVHDPTMGRGAGPNAARRSLEQAKQHLAEGRSDRALESLRQARRRGQPQPRILDLLECQSLLGLGRYPEALALASRSLGRARRDGDVAVRLRIARAHALWLTGRPGPARLEAERAVALADVPLTRARALEAQALFAWKDQDPEAARRPAEAALQLYVTAACREGTVRALEIRAGLLRDAGRLEESLAVHEHRLELARAGSRRDVVALCEADRAGVLAVLGRWRDAGWAAETSADLFRALGDPREVTVAGAVRALVCLAAGDLPGAQLLLAAGEEALQERPNQPRARIENLLLTSDLSLAAGDAARADRLAAEALRLSALVHDAEGQCRGRVRRTQALLTLDRVPEALAEARRAQKVAPPARPDLVSLAGLTLGRALLRTDRAAAAEAFERVLEVSGARLSYAAIVRAGCALARGARRDDPEVAKSLSALEAWGDRRLLAYTLADVGAVTGEDPAADVPLPAQLVSAPVDSATAVLVEAAHALDGEGSWLERWAAAMRAVRPALPWWRAILVGEVCCELRADLERPIALAADDLARRLAASCRAPVLVPLATEPALRRHPTRVLHGLGVALLAPVAPDLVLYADVREERAALGAKPLEVLVALARLLSRHRPEPPGGGPPDEGEMVLSGMVGRSPVLRGLLRTLRSTAASDLTVHVCGETGTGKERVAQALHQLSRRAHRPFVVLNASAFSDELFESEMFGHVKGSFTGAVSDRAGHVAEAEGGTLFLDEVTDLSAKAQARLLRLLEQKEYRRVGETHLRRADIRFVAASNVPIKTRVEQGRFRQDLMYRLTRMVVTVPPLRERGDDVPLLARHFLRRAAARAGVSPPALTAELERRLVRHSWPGNVRELENEMDRWVALAGAGPVQPEHLSPALLAPPAPAGTASLKDALQVFERQHIAGVLDQQGGNRARTASLLGLSRQALVAKISRLGIGAGPRLGGTGLLPEAWGLA